MSDHMPERRGFPRADSSFVAVIKGISDVAIGRIHEIGLDGVYIRLQTDIMIINDEFVTVSIYAEGSEENDSSFQVQGRVVWIDEKEVGIQFRPMTVVNQDRLLEIISFLGDQDQIAGMSG
jgi:hypothetical protein